MIDYEGIADNIPIGPNNETWNMPFQNQSNIGMYYFFFGFTKASMSSVNNMKSDDPRFEKYTRGVLRGIENDFSVTMKLIGKKNFFKRPTVKTRVSEFNPRMMKTNHHHKDRKRSPNVNYAKHKSKWSMEPPNPNKLTRHHDLIIHLSGVINAAKRIQTIKIR